eukprot:2362211-Lingulodinium_polyedra.AAC.1
MTARGNPARGPEFSVLVAREEQELATAWTTRLKALASRAGGHLCWFTRFLAGRAPGHARAW